MPAPAPAPARPRIAVFDTLRGFALVSMVAFHAVYDLAYLYGMEVPWFTAGPVQDLWRDSISWTFLVLAGWMTSLSRRNLRRGGIYAAAALLVWAVTSVAAVDTPISFGIIFCMAASTLMWALVERGVRRLPASADLMAAAAALVLFALTQGVPRTVYAVDGLAWLGLPSPAFASGDYYPLVPFAFLYLAGAFAAAAWARTERPYPAWMRRDWIPPLTAVGKASLPVYLVHQPVVLGVLEALAQAGFLG